MRRAPRFFAAAFILLTATGYAAAPTPEPTSPDRRQPVRIPSVGRVILEVGVATYYAEPFHGRLTASGVPYDMNTLVAAHPSLPFGTLVRATNLVNGRSVHVRIVDRGPAEGPRATGVVIDLSLRAAEALRMVQRGRVPVRLELLD